MAAACHAVRALPWRALGGVRVPWPAQRACVCRFATKSKVFDGFHGEPRDRLYVIDLLPHVYRACAPNMPGGTPPDETVVAGDVAQLLVGLLLDRDPPPTHVAVVVDVPGQGTFRHALYPGFKHGRQAPKLVMDAVPRVLALVDALGWPVIAVPGVQADDVAASLALRANKDGLDAVIVSSHKGYKQLLRPGVSLLRHPGDALYTEADLAAAAHWLPLGSAHLWADVLALSGNDADNVPGVRGIGIKTAVALVRGIGGVEEVLAAAVAHDERLRDLDGVKPRPAQLAMLRSTEGMAAARLSKQLVTFATDLRAPPLWRPWQEFEVRLPSDGGAAALERAHGMNMTWAEARLQKDLLPQLQAAAHQ